MVYRLFFIVTQISEACWVGEIVVAVMPAARFSTGTLGPRDLCKLTK